MKLTSLINIFGKKKSSASKPDSLGDDLEEDIADDLGSGAGDDLGDLDEEGSAAAGDYTLKEKFLAWWDGVDVKTVRARRGADDHDDDAPDDDLPAKGAGKPPAKEENGKEEKAPDKIDMVGEWSPLRIEVAEKIWGQGYISPGVAEDILEMVKPLGINPKQSLADLGAGLGGAARTISEKFELWVIALEADRNLVAAGMKQSTDAGMAKKAPVEICDLEKLDFNGKKYDVIISKEIFFTVKGKKQLFKAIFESLKPGGQFLFTDFVLTVTDGIGTEEKNWVLSEPIAPEMWSVKQIRDHLASLGFDIRIEEDMTKTYLERFLVGWQNFVNILKHGDFSEDSEEARALLSEAEFWRKREKVLTDGNVRVYRFHAFKK